MFEHCFKMFQSQKNRGLNFVFGFLAVGLNMSELFYYLCSVPTSSAALKLKVEKHERPFQRSVLSKLFRGKPNIVKMLEICDTIVKSDRFNKAEFKAFF